MNEKTKEILQEEGFEKFVPFVDPAERERRRFHPPAGDIETLKELHTIERNLLKMRIRIENQVAANIANGLGYSNTLSKSEREKLFKRAKGAYNKAKGTAVKPDPKSPLLAVDLECAEVKALPEETQQALKGNLALITATVNAVAPIDDKYNAITDGKKGAIVKIIWEWSIWKDHFADVKGLGALTVGRIVAEAGDLNNYPPPGTSGEGPAKLWKRFGVAVMPDGYIQGKIPPNLSKEEAKEAWRERGYSPRRRSILWVGTGTLLKTNDGRYRRICDHEFQRQYDRRDPGMIAQAEEKVRKAAEGKKISEKTFKDRVERRFKGHCRARAARYVSKRLLKDMWMIWTGVAADYDDIRRIERELNKKFGYGGYIDWDAA